MCKGSRTETPNGTFFGVVCHPSGTKPGTTFKWSNGSAAGGVAQGYVDLRIEQYITPQHPNGGTRLWNCHLVEFLCCRLRIAKWRFVQNSRTMPVLEKSLMCTAALVEHFFAEKSIHNPHFTFRNWNASVCACWAEKWPKLSFGRLWCPWSVRRLQHTWTPEGEGGTFGNYLLN